MIFTICVSCSLTQNVQDGESILISNNIIFKNKNDKAKITDLEKYIRQKPQSSLFGFNTKVMMYNINKKWGSAPILYDKNLTISSLSNMRNHLEYLGYYNSVVKDSVISDDKLTKVHYIVTLGNTYLIDSIVYSAPDEQMLNILLNYRDKSEIQSGKILSENLLESESVKIAEMFQNSGYFNFNKNYLFFKADTLLHNGKANLSIDIKEYTRAQTEEQSRKHNVYTFKRPLIKTTRTFQNRSRFDFEEDSTTLARRDSLLRVIDILTDTVNYRDVDIVRRMGQTLVKNRFLNRANLIKENTIYKKQIIEDTYSRFASLGLFSNVNIQLQEEDSLIIQPIINLQASTLQGYKASLQGSVNSNGLFGISPAVSYYHKNLFKGAELFSIGFTGDFQFKPHSSLRSTELGVVSSIDFPRFILAPNSWFKSKTLPHTQITLSYNYQTRPEFTRNIIAASYNYSWNVGEKLFLRATPLQANIVRVYNLDSLFFSRDRDPYLQYSYQNHFDVGVGANVYYTTDPSANPIKNYFYFRYQVDLAGNLISLFNKNLKKNDKGERLIWNSPYTQYFTMEASGVYTIKFNANPANMLSMRLLAGVGKGYGNSKILPFEKQLWGGGAYSLRGWQPRTLGPGSAPRDTTFRLPNQTGDIRLEANIEYRFPMFWLLRGAIFVDAGNIWTFKRKLQPEDELSKYQADSRGVFKFNNFYKHIALDWGLGLRLDITFAILRLDIGFKTYNPATSKWVKPKDYFRDNNTQISFGVGYPF